MASDGVSPRRFAQAGRQTVSARFGANLRARRKRAGLAQAELGDRASANRIEVGMWERGERLPRIDTLLRLAGSLSVQPGELLDGIVWRLDQTERGRFEVAD